MEKQESMPLGVVVEWRRIDHPWKDHDWRPVAVIAGALVLVLVPHPWTWPAALLCTDILLTATSLLISKRGAR